MNDNIQIKAIITGRVQGVFFRAKTKREAMKLGIQGYVKNLANGSVEAVFQAEPLKISQMIKWCNKGPAASSVEHVLTEQIEHVINFDGFTIRY
jgi:acylphosphatase